MGKKVRRRDSRVAVAGIGQRARDRRFNKWMQKMQRDHPAEYAEAMRRLEERKDQ